ncbi:uncharacterized protein LOC135205505 isoform X1 [Macrobrachium nipponense]|uniref:uncharacterized protein LOC135205505 isoform X1 n=1 Tax=Macrobrachium nipponense TaxID=159736 RepID=UPI0030C82A3E
MKPVCIRPEGIESKRRVTCYVCGHPGCAEYPLAVRQQASGPYFPFLETHEPPDGAEPPSQDGHVLSCFLCFSYLTQQWESYEREKVPPVKRFYWLKRVDQGPYTGVEGGVQSEYVSQLLGLTTDPPPVPADPKRPPQSSSSSSITGSGRVHPAVPMASVTPGGIHEAKRVRILPPQAQPPTMPLPPPGIPTLPLLTVPQPLPQQEALDLTIDRGRGRGTKRSQIDSSPQTEGLLDLSMPDKNATTEVCYVCGDHHKKGTLVDIYAKQQLGGCPFFPSLTNHSRPSKSHPMEASGRVQACRECFSHLQHQWDTYEAHKIPHSERNYSLRKRNSSASLSSSSHDSTAFVCYKCGCEFSSSKLCLIYCKPNCEKEPYYPLIQDLEAPEGASPISPQGMVQVCSLCFKTIPQEQARLQAKSLEANRSSSPEGKTVKAETITTSGRQHTSSPMVASPLQHNPQIIMPHPISESLVEEVACYLCHQTHHRQMMHWLSMVADKGTSNGMYFLFLKFLPRNSSNTVIEDGKVLACRPCYQHLNTQWEEYEKENVPTEQRQFSLRFMPATSHSPRLTPGSPDRANTADSTSPQPFANALKVNDIVPMKSSSASSGYLGQPIHTLEVVPATQDPNLPTLPVITTQHALNIAINCFVCSFHSKPGQTYALRSKAQGTEPFFPFLAKHQSAHPEARVDANSVLVCLCCFHSLILQWQQYEKAQVDHNARLYDTYNYTCFICSLKTYRKRLYLLPVKDYPFLKEHNRPSGGMVVDNGHSVVVCKDCYSSLKSQYLELERWGVPVERRQYNWIQRPPPPEFQQELPASGSKPISQGLTQGTTLPVVVAGAGASSPGLHPGMSPESLSQSSVTGRAPASPRASQGPVSKPSSAHGMVSSALRSSAAKHSEETIPVTLPETHTFKGFSGNGITSLDQSAKAIFPKRKFLTVIPREGRSPDKVVSPSHPLEKEKASKTGQNNIDSHADRSNSPQIQKSSCSPHMVSTHELQAKCS